MIVLAISLSWNVTELFMCEVHACRCRLDTSRGLVFVATWSVGSRLGGQKGGVALHVSCSAVTLGELSVPVLGMSYPSVPTKEQTTADSVCFSVHYQAIAGPLVCLVLWVMVSRSRLDVSRLRPPFRNPRRRFV